MLLIRKSEPLTHKFPPPLVLSSHSYRLNPLALSISLSFDAIPRRPSLVVFIFYVLFLYFCFRQLRNFFKKKKVCFLFWWAGPTGLKSITLICFTLPPPSSSVYTLPSALTRLLCPTLRGIRERSIAMDVPAVRHFAQSMWLLPTWQTPNLFEL